MLGGVNIIKLTASEQILIIAPRVKYKTLLLASDQYFNVTTFELHPDCQSVETLPT